jgi:integrase
MASIDDRRWTKPNGVKAPTGYKGDKPWRARWRAHPGAPQQTQHFAKKSDAEAFLLDLEHGKATGSYVDPKLGQLAFGRWWDMWRATRVDLKPSTMNRDATYYRNYIEPSFADVPLAKVDRTALRTWIAELSAKGLAPATVQKAAQLVSKALGAAVDDRRLAQNPAWRLPLPSVEVKEMRFLEPGEVAALAEAIDPRYRVWLLTAAYSGLRFGELAALRRGRVDLVRRRIDVVENVADVSGVHYYGTPKTRAGRRSVPIPAALAGELTAWMGARAANDLVFPAPEGGTLRPSLFNRRTWQPAIHKAGVVPLRPHDLRHTCVAIWIAGGANPKEIATWAGHASVSTVLDRYGHLLDGQEERVMDALDLMFTTAMPAADGTVLKLLRTQ